MDDIDVTTRPSEEEALKALARRARKNRRAREYYQRNRERINDKRRRKYHRDRDLIRTIEQENQGA